MFGGKFFLHVFQYGHKCTAALPERIQVTLSFRFDVNRETAMFGQNAALNLSHLLILVNLTGDIIPDVNKNALREGKALRSY
jgi:hypothetical protein